MVYGLTVVVELTSPEMLPKFIAAFEPLHAASNDPSRDSGCLSYELLQANDDSSTVLIMERFRDQHSHKNIHRNQPAFQAFSTWLRGDAIKSGVVKLVSGRHFVSAGKAVPAEGAAPIHIPQDIQRLSRVCRNVRVQVQPMATEETPTATSQDPTAFRFEEVRDGVLIFGGARAGSKPEYMQVSAEVGKAVAKSGRRFVYGGGVVGCMGAAARAALEASDNDSSRVIGIIPKALFPRELSGDCIGTVVVTDTMAHRKDIMFRCSSAVISCPGGIGTLDELLEALTLFQLNAVRHKIVLVNACGFYEPLVALLKAQIEAGFLEEKVFSYFTLYNGTGEDIMEHLEKFPLAPPAAPLDWSVRADGEE